MIGFDSLIAQQQPVQIINAILHKGTIPHALLFTGAEGVGKRTAALAFAAALNCSGGEDSSDSDQAAIGADAANTASQTTKSTPCGVCRSCRKIERGIHPDIITVQPIGPFIRIDQIRELCRTLSMKPYEAEYRTVAISDAHCMNAEAGNALLKMLEEPPDRTILILTASGIVDLLPTIVSRCRHIRFNPIPVDILALELKENHGLDPHDARALAVMSGGSRSKAIGLFKNNWVNRRKWLLQTFPDLIQHSHGEKQSYKHLAIASTLSSDKDLSLDTLEMLKTIYRDALIYRYQPENLLNPDAEKPVACLSALLDETHIHTAVKAIDEARNRIRANAGVRLTLEALFLTLAKYSEMN